MQRSLVFFKDYFLFSKYVNCIANACMYHKFLILTIKYDTEIIGNHWFLKICESLLSENENKVSFDKYSSFVILKNVHVLKELLLFLC